jgi:hypothetical protein
MATPKVFISSTCYDLGQIRDSLSEFISSYCYEPVLSERGDVFFHPDLHTHSSCINEIENCQLFILIIGGRFGGNYKFDKSKSITNAEYEAAIFKKIPIFTFIKKEVFDDHKYYQKNKSKIELLKQLDFPSMDNQDYAINIFEFINQVRLSGLNNGFFQFEFVKDIKHFLGKQWAGMMFDFLNNRNKDYNQKVVNNTLDNLTLINKKTEELLENILENLNPKEAKKQIQEIDKVIIGAKFYTHVMRMFEIKAFKESNDKLSNINPSRKTWYEYLECFKGFSILQGSDIHDFDSTSFKTLAFLNYEDDSWSCLTDTNEYPEMVNELKELFESLKLLTKEERNRALTLVASSNSNSAKSERITKTK